MFYYLEGAVTVIEQNLAVIDIGGAGYACYTTMNTLSYLETGKPARLYTYCNIKEDAFDIYGFYNMSEKRCFEMLISVSGVGPKAAISILSASTPENLALAIINNDERTLTVAKGVGKRLAQRVILELRDKIGKDIDVSPVPGGGDFAHDGGGMTGTKLGDAEAGLMILGYSRNEIAAAMRNIDAEDLTVEEIIRQILKSSLK